MNCSVSEKKEKKQNKNKKGGFIFQSSKAIVIKIVVIKSLLWISLFIRCTKFVYDLESYTVYDILC